VLRKEYIHLPLHDISFVEEKLPDLCDTVLNDPGTAAWEKEIFIFIQQWARPADTLRVSTSGTTGTPSVITVQRQCMINSASITEKTFNLARGDTALLCLPAQYIAGKMMIVRAFVTGLNLICVAPGINPLDKLDMDIDFTALVPMQLERAIQESNLSRVRTILVGGGILSEEMKNKAEQVSAKIFETYSLTETLSHVAVKPLNGNDRSNVFSALEGVNFATDHRGCLIINAPQVAAEPVVTNDLAALHDSRTFELLGRLDNVINSGGIKIVAERVEKKLEDLIPDYRYFIAGKKDASLGERVVLIIEGSPFTLSKEMLAGCLDTYERPKEILFVPEFEETESGKISRIKTLEKC